MKIYYSALWGFWIWIKGIGAISNSTYLCSGLFNIKPLIQKYENDWCLNMLTVTFYPISWIGANSEPHWANSNTTRKIL